MRTSQRITRYLARQPSEGTMIGTKRIFAYPAEFVTLPEYTAHAGQTVEVLRRLGPEEVDEIECGPMYEIRAADGWRGHAFESELEPE